MPAYKDQKKGTWYASFYYEDWKGVRKKKMKRGFETKKEAQQWERQFLLQQAADSSRRSGTCRPPCHSGRIPEGAGAFQEYGRASVRRLTYLSTGNPGSVRAYRRYERDHHAVKG